MIVFFSLLVFRLLLLFRFGKVSAHILIVCVSECVCTMYYSAGFSLSMLSILHLTSTLFYLPECIVYITHFLLLLLYLPSLLLLLVVYLLRLQLCISECIFLQTWFHEASVCTDNNSYSSPTNPLFILITLLYIILISFISFTSRINNYSFVHGEIFWPNHNSEIQDVCEREWREREWKKPTRCRFCVSRPENPMYASVL